MWLQKETIEDPSSFITRVHTGVMRTGFEEMNRYLTRRTAEL
jgi:hypothetical protein